MSWWTVGWLAWAAWFAVEEGLALARGNVPATLSGHVWRWFATAPGAKGPLVRTRRVVLLGFLAWLLVHFVGGGRLM